MKNLFSVRIPSICICFTLITLANALLNLFYGNTSLSLFSLELFGWIVICQVIDWLLGHIDFKSWLAYCLTESTILYLGTLAVSLLFHWFAPNIRNFISFTLIFLVVDSFIFWYFKRRQELLAKEINGML